MRARPNAAEEIDLYIGCRLAEEAKSPIYQVHSSIGNALYYTSVTIIVGFSILAASEFIPSILFGLLTGLAMAMALLAALTLLPRLIILFKPFGPQRVETSDTP